MVVAEAEEEKTFFVKKGREWKKKFFRSKIEIES
jgi:hypothetical protein